MITTEYPITPEDQEMLDTRFEYHAPVGDQTQRYFEIRSAAKSLASKLLQNCPRCPELTLALRDLERAVFWSNASIARNEKEAGT